MVKTLRAFFLSFTILAFLLFSTIGTTTVYADDGTGTETSETVVTTSEEEQPSEPQAGEEPPTGDEEQPSAGENEETLPAGDEGQPVEETVTEEPVQTILEQVPDNTTVTVLNSEGEALPLVSQEAADIIVSGTDPVWCPAGKLPGDAECTANFLSFTALLQELETNPVTYQGAGTIFIEQGVYGGSETAIDFNSYDLSGINTSALTLQGGWNPVDNTTNSTSTFEIPIIIGSSTSLWGGSLTINNINITGVADQTGLTLHTTDNIELNKVEVTNSETGAELHAGGDVDVVDSNFHHNKKGGAVIDAGGNVYVDFSNFDNNGSKTTDGYGLQIESGGETSLFYVSASNNEAFGADITADESVYIDAGFFNGNKTYSYTCDPQTVTGGYGLKVISQGDIIVESGYPPNPAEGIEANDNYEFGAYLQGVNVTVGFSTFNNNSSGDIGNPIGKGLEVASTGNVTLTSLEANNNQLFGANIDTTGDVIITDGLFNSNQGITYNYNWKFDGYGLKVVTTDGNIKLDTVTANDNYVFGANLKGASVEIANSFFNMNSSDGKEESTAYGLEVIGSGKVTLSNVNANQNQVFGANIETGGPVKITDSFFNGNVSYTWWGEKEFFGYGIRIVTDREVSLENVEAMENHLYGAFIDAKDVAIDTANFSNNSSNDPLNLTGYGLKVISDFTVALANVTADNNQLFGADIHVFNDSQLPDDTSLVSVEQSSFNGHIAYYHDYFSGEILSRDGGYGLKVITYGNIAVEDVSANGNYLYGASLQGKEVTVEDGSFSSNGSGVMTEPPGNDYGYGLKVVATGEVEFVGVTANSNQFFGADIKSGAGVTVLKSFFSGNQSVTWSPCHDEVFFHGYGLTVNTDEDIFLNFVTANRNNLWGASLTGYNVTVYNSQFNNNISDSTLFIDDTGLLVDAKGDVDIWKIEAKENRLIGAQIKAEGDVYVSDSTFTGNSGYTCLYDWCPEGSITYHGFGLQVTTPGYIEVTGTNASDNTLYGAELNGGLVFVANSTFNNNEMGNGLTVNATDDVTLTNVTALNNGGNGVEVNGIYCDQIVQVNGGTFSDNLLYGISVLNATLILDGTQVFIGNGAGDDPFNDTSTCVVVIPTVTPSFFTASKLLITSPSVAQITRSSKPPVSPVTIANTSSAPSLTTFNSQPVSPVITLNTANNQTTSSIITMKSNQKHETTIGKVVKKASRKGMTRVMKAWGMRPYISPR